MKMDVLSDLSDGLVIVAMEMGIYAVQEKLNTIYEYWFKHASIDCHLTEKNKKNGKL